MIATVLGASGNTGSVVAQRLSAAGAQVRAFARSADKLQTLVQQGIQPVLGDVLDARALTDALRGSDIAYAMVPPRYDAADPIAYYDQVASSLAAALGQSGIRRVVLLSSLGAELSVGTGIVVGLNHVEQKLKALPRLELLILRAGYFYENFLGSIGLIQAMGVNGGATKGDVPIPMIAAGDIGDLAAKAILAGDFTGVHELV
ncbi:MAG TPA: NAD(P)H-binding protein, partial [Polyangia bacterium]|nr:NAD(P)H-binding protein [Polyangia bacterium]